MILASIVAKVLRINIGTTEGTGLYLNGSGSKRPVAGDRMGDGFPFGWSCQVVGG